MTLTDSRGLDLSLTDNKAVDSYDGALGLFLNYEASAGQAVKQLFADHPDCVMGSVLRGYMMLMIETTAVQPKIAALAKSLSTEATHANQREQLHIAALAHWANGEVRAAAVKRQLPPASAERRPASVVVLEPGQPLQSSCD